LSRSREAVARRIAFLKTALKLNPGFLTAHASLGHAYLHLGRYSEAIPHLREARALHDKPPSFRLHRLTRSVESERQSPPARIQALRKR
jgi:cytochrome c-type biogenesis protein CcmH/NrfG